jgi:hypothetical protein
MLIDGKLVAADSGSTFENVNPATEEALGTVADASGPVGSAIRWPMEHMEAFSVGFAGLHQHVETKALAFPKA